MYIENNKGEIKMKEYFGTYLMGNGTFFEVFIDENKTYTDANGIKITESELENYKRID